PPRPALFPPPTIHLPHPPHKPVDVCAARSPLTTTARQSRSAPARRSALAVALPPAGTLPQSCQHFLLQLELRLRIRPALIGIGLQRRLRTNRHTGLMTNVIQDAMTFWRISAHYKSFIIDPV